MADPVDLVSVQESLLVMMKASPEMMSSAATDVNGKPEIREDDWMSRNFKYPAYRLQIQMAGSDPTNNGECQPFISLIRFSVLCFAEGGSSLTCLAMMDIAKKALVNKQLRTSKLIPVTRIYVPPSGAIMPVPEAERTWRGEVQFLTTVKGV
jgi:hypothetical protein